MLRFGKTVQVVQNVAMRRAFVANLDFELELQGIGTNESLRKKTVALGWCWTALSRPGDVLLVEDTESALEFRSKAVGRELLAVSSTQELDEGEFEIVPWGWSQRTREIAGEFSVEGPEPPPEEVVRKVNGRSWAFRCEAELESAPDGSSRVVGFGQLQGALRRAAEEGNGWLIKKELGMAGREQRRGKGEILEEATRRWVESSLQAGWPVLVEPYLDIVGEWGLQYEIRRDGPIDYVGGTELLTTLGGQYRGSRLLPSGNEGLPPGAESVRTATDTTAVRLQEAGYWGPVGIDVAQYRDPRGRTHWRPVQDVNARFTMGRLALGWRDLLGEEDCASWLQVRCHEPVRIDDQLAAANRSLPAGTRIARTSPLCSVGVTGVGHVLIICRDTAELRAAERAVLGTLEKPDEIRGG